MVFWIRYYVTVGHPWRHQAEPRQNPNKVVLTPKNGRTFGSVVDAIVRFEYVGKTFTSNLLVSELKKRSHNYKGVPTAKPPPRTGCGYSCWILTKYREWGRDIEGSKQFFGYRTHTIFCTSRQCLHNHPAPVGKDRPNSYRQLKRLNISTPRSSITHGIQRWCTCISVHTGSGKYRAQVDAGCYFRSSNLEFNCYRANPKIYRGSWSKIVCPSHDVGRTRITLPQSKYRRPLWYL
jgi:hypothetical protein